MDGSIKKIYRKQSKYESEKVRLFQSVQSRGERPEACFLENITL
jgi:hypothetical protein